jgi:FkbM family methyltransferase
MRSILSHLFYLWAAIYEAYRGLLWKLTASITKNITLKVHKDISLKLTSYGYITKRIYQQQLLVPFKKSFEYETLDLLRKTIKPDFQILDIGANIGLHSMIMAKELSSNGKIYSFEPSKKTYSSLVENIKLNGLGASISTFNLALSNKAETLFLAAPESANISEADADAYNSLRHTQTGKGNAEEIQAITLDSWIIKENIKKIDLIKIDIEGAELLCFQGAKEFFTNHKPIIIMECCEQHLAHFNNSIFDVLNYLSQFGYKFEEQTDWNWIATPKSI